jgi:hypothetical protein
MVSLLDGKAGMACLGAVIAAAGPARREATVKFR